MITVLYLTDKTGVRMWNTVCGFGCHHSEESYIKWHLANVKAGKYPKVPLDPHTARFVMEVDGVVQSEDRTITQDDLALLDELMTVNE